MKKAIFFINKKRIHSRAVTGEHEIMYIHV
jgi:hypothetical protein